MSNIDTEMTKEEGKYRVKIGFKTRAYACIAESSGRYHSKDRKSRHERRALVFLIQMHSLVPGH